MELVQGLCFDLNGAPLDDSGVQLAIRRTCEDIAAAEPELNATRLLAANGQAWGSIGRMSRRHGGWGTWMARA